MEEACNNSTGAAGRFGDGGCTAIIWHKTDDHCHLLSGVTPTREQFAAALKADSEHAACVMLEAGQ